MSRDPRSEVYRHQKTGGLYIVIEWDVYIEASRTKAVVYRNLCNGGTWVRPYEEFMDGRFKCLSRDELRKLLTDVTDEEHRSKTALSDG
jgi:hypothetical protein